MYQCTPDPYILLVARAFEAYELNGPKSILKMKLTPASSGNTTEGLQ